MSLARRSLQVVAFLCTLVVGVASMAVIVTQTAWFKEWLRGFIVRQSEDYVNGRLSIGRLGGNLFFGVELDDVGVTMNGERVVGASSLDVDYNVFDFLAGEIVIDSVQLDEPMVRLERSAEGWNLARLVKARPEPPDPQPGPTVRVEEIGISGGTLYVEDAVGTSGVNVPRQVEDIDASLGVTSGEDGLRVALDRLSLHAIDPSFTIETLSGRIRQTGEAVTFEQVVLRSTESELQIDGSVTGLRTPVPALDVRASSGRLSLAEVARIVPALSGYDILPSFEITASGPADDLAVVAHVQEDRVGTVTADLAVDAIAPARRVAGTMSVRRLNVAPLIPPPESPDADATPITSDITGTATFDLALPDAPRPLSGTWAVETGRIEAAGYQVQRLKADGRIDGETVRLNLTTAAYGGRATAAGTVRTGDPLVVDIAGTVSDVDLRNLPASLDAPGVPSDVNARYAVRGRGDALSGTITFQPTMLAGATIVAGSSGSFEIGRGAPQYSARGRVEALDLQQLGQGFGIEALAADRYRSRINASFEVNGSGGGEFPLALDATGTIAETTMFDATFPAVEFAARVADGNVHVTTRGEFADLNPATVADDPKLAGTVNGAIDAETTLRDYASGVTVDSIDVAGRITLTDSNVADLVVTRAVVDGRYSNREGRIAQLEMTGPDLDVTGEGYLSLTETGSSNLTLHAGTASLERIGELVGQPLEGMATVDATVTGNATRLDVAGTFTGSDLGYGDTSALSVTSDFDVTIPDLSPADATVDATTMATFLEVGGQRITELAADVTYVRKTLEFMATAQEGTRELDAGGSVVFHPDHQEIHLLSLGLRTEDVEWRTPPGTDVAVEYAANRLDVQGLELLNGAQRIAAAGVIGSASEPLRVTLENIDVAEVDRLLLGDLQVAGRLNAEATVLGPTDALSVDAQMTLSDGSFRTYTFSSLTGSVEYEPAAVTFDVRLEQTPSEWLDAKGTAPMTLFQATPPDVAGHREASPGDTVDITLQSSQIGLGLIQGFTTLVTGVAGVMQADVRVTGSGYDPHLEGTLEISGGAFEVPELGTSYTDLDVRVDLTPEGLRIETFRLLDNRGFPLTVGGTLGFHARAVGAVDVTLESDRFEVIDNQVADVKLNTGIRVSGDLRAPRVEGTIEVENGTIHLEELLARVTADPYATEAESVEGQAGEPAAADEEPSGFDAMALDLTVSVPDNLVLRGDDVRAAGAAVPLGDMNITVGGDIQIDKAPNEALALSGQVNTVRGTYTFQGRRFEIMRDGRIGFSGGEEIDPALDIRARREITGIETFVNVRGTMRMPELSFSSNPPLDEGDVLALIVFNQPINQLGEGEQISLADRAAALAGGYLTLGLARSIGNALELDEFQIEAVGDEGSGPSVTVGEQVGRNLFVRLMQEFGSEHTTELVLEYQIADFLRAQGSIAEGSPAAQTVQFRRVERAGLDLIFFFSY